MQIEIKIAQDSNTPCPFDPSGERLVVFHRRYQGTHDFPTPEAAWAWAKEEGWKVFPVYAYIHSGVVLRASEGGNPFSDSWDSGLFGLLLLNRKYWGRRPTLKQASALLKEYNSWMEGDCWSYTVRVGDQEDSCGGFIGKDTVREAAQEAARRLLGKALEEELERAWKKATEGGEDAAH